MADQEILSFFGENRSLFSDYYLRKRLHTLDEWDRDISEPFEKALEIYQDKKEGDRSVYSYITHALQFSGSN